MIPFPGESIGIFDAADGADFTLGTEVTLRGSTVEGSPTSRTLASGEQWRAWVSPGNSDYLEDGTEDAVVSWVVEVLSGTLTVTAGERYDPTFADDPTLAPTRSLGSHSITGPGTLVIPSGITVAEVFDAPGTGPAFMLHMAATAGAAVVQQVKLRVWPPGGPLGGWSDVKPSWDTGQTAPAVRYSSPAFSGDATDADPAASWDAAGTAFHAAVSAGSGASSRGFGSTPPVVIAQQGMSQPELGQYATSWLLSPVLIMLTGRDWRRESPISSLLVHGVDWVRPPTEVNGDLAYYAQQIGEGSTGWVDATITVSSSGDLPGSVTFAAASGQWADDDPTAATAHTVAVDPGAATTGVQVLPTSGPMILATVSHTIASGDADTYPGWAPSTIGSLSRNDDVGYGLGPVKSYATLPPYRVWTPGTVALPIPQQWKQRRDGRGMDSVTSWRNPGDSQHDGRWAGRL